MIWNPNPTNTSCMVIDEGTKVKVPSGVKLTNNSEIIISNGVLEIEDMKSYEGSTGIIRIGPYGKVIIPEFDISMYDGCAADAVVLTNGTKHTFNGESWE